jgi:hypothetical protein
MEHGPLLSLRRIPDDPAQNERQEQRMAQLSDEDAAAVRAVVEREQFELDRVTTIGGFGDEQRVWERDGALVRLTRDRGQWWCELSHRGWTEWFDIDLVAGALGSKSDGVVDRLRDVVGTFTDGRLLEPLRAFRDRSR